MLIEQKTSYAYKLKYLENPTFDKVRGFAKSFIDDLPKELVDELYTQLERGVGQIDSEPQMLVYLYSFGNMHQAKLNKSFENIPKILFDQPEINIIDYGCGQAIGTMCYIDFIRQKGVSQNVKRVTLIEPSETCLKRAALHVSAFCSDAEIVTINKTFDDLDAADIVCEEEIPTLHILSNVLDLDFDLDRFAELISDNLKGYNQFVCVGPYFNVPAIDQLMDDFAKLFSESEDNYIKIFSKFELNPNKAWTAHIRCFSVGELEVELSTEVTKEEINSGVEDEFGVVYSGDGKRLLKCKNAELKIYIVKNGTKVICDNAFPGETTIKHLFGELKKVILPNSVTAIGRSAFSGCLSLQQINIPNSVTSIGESAFSDCSSLQQITIPNSVTSIRKSVFEGCKSLQQLTIPNSVTSIGDSAFGGCESLQHIIIPKSVTSIGINPFVRCSLHTLESQSFRFIVENGLLIDKKEHSIISYIGDSVELTIPKSVTSIGDSAFSGCSSLQQITIPNSVTSIGERAFSCSSLQQITIPDSVTIIGKSAFRGCSSLQQITIPNSVTSIGEEAFCNCKSLQQITIPISVTSIGDSAFDSCESLQQITIPNSVTSIGEGAFSCCKSLQQITIPNSVTSILERLFGGCESTIANSVTSIGEGAFWGCESLQHIIIPNSVTSIEKSTFENCLSLQQIIIPNSVTSIGERAFSCCISLQQITIPNSVKSIGDLAFWGCSSLKQITIPNSVTSIGRNSFLGCSSLTLESQSFRFIIDNGLLIDRQEQIIISYVGNNKEITIPNSVMRIDAFAFDSCKSLQQITIPNSVTNIGNRAFRKCESLQQIIITNQVTSIGQNAFEKCKSLQQIIIPEGSEQHFKQLLPKYLWDKLYCLKKVVVVEPQVGGDDLPF